MSGIVMLYGAAYAFELLDLTDDAAHGVTVANLQNDDDIQVKCVLVTNEGETVNFTEHGTDPTATSGTNIGHQLVQGGSYIVNGIENVARFKAINAVAGADGIVKITFYT